MTIRFYRRSLETRTGALEEAVIYAVREVIPSERTDPVNAYGGFPLTWRPTPNPGEVLRDPGCHQQYWLCQVPRSQFRHYQEISRDDALAAYAGLAAAPSPRRPSATQSLQP